MTWAFLVYTSRREHVPRHRLLVPTIRFHLALSPQAHAMTAVATSRPATPLDQPAIEAIVEGPPGTTPAWVRSRGRAKRDVPVEVTETTGTSLQDLLHHVAPYVREAEVATRVPVGQFLVVQAQEVEERGV